MTAELPVPTWTWRASIRLELRALGWMLGATLPVVTVVGVLVAPAVPGLGGGLGDGTWWSTAGNAVVAAVYMDAVSLIPTVVGAVVALPFTMLLGVLMRPVRHRVLHVLSTALLAGALAAVPAAGVAADLAAVRRGVGRRGGRGSARPGGWLPARGPWVGAARPDQVSSATPVPDETAQPTA